jgi:tight adherence protein C
MYEILVPLLVFLSVLAIGGAVVEARATRKQTLAARLKDSAWLESEALRRDRGPRWLGLFGHVGSAVSGGRTSPGLRAELASAGFHHRSAGFIYLGTKIFLMIVALVTLTVVLLPLESLSFPAKVLLIVVGTGVVFFIPNAVIGHRRTKRKGEIQRHLADALDLLEICVSAGMGLDAAWNWVEEQMRIVSATLADEMALCTLEMHLGAPRAAAMRHMAERTEVEDIVAMVGVLVQSEQFGTSISDALRTFASTMRDTRSMRAEESAEKMPLKMLFPLVLLIFPAVLVVICGPSAIRWTEIMSGRG